MSLFLSKLLRVFIFPLPLGLLLMGGGAVAAYVSREGWGRWVGWGTLGGGLLLLWGASTPLVADGLQGALEHRYPPRPMAAVPSADAIVVLGGALGAPRPPRVHPDLSGAADRVWHAARLYHADKAPLIIASGGTVPWQDQRFREATAMQRLLTSWGVPADSVLLEARSANTYENARYTAELMRRRDLDHVLLVTSAQHMRRALATFRSAGVDARPAATDYHVTDAPMTVLDLMPSADALSGSTAAIREYVGYLVYRWRGWIDAPPR